MKPLFDVIGDVVTGVETEVRVGLDTSDDAARFQLMVLQRAGNLLKAMKLLAGNGYWELASAGARQLFEILINMEHLVSLENLDEGVHRYLTFGVLQGVRSRVAELTYARDTERPYDAALLTRLEEALDSRFPEFATRRPDGTIRWDRNWCGRDARSLAQESSDPIRIHQYDQLFTHWSEETHASPGALIRGMEIPRGDDGIRRMLDREHDRIWQVLVMGHALVLELWRVLPAASDPRPDDLEKWAGGLSTFLQGRAEDIPQPPVWPAA